jgi:hypothetical protein
MNKFKRLSLATDENLVWVVGELAAPAAVLLTVLLRERSFERADAWDESRQRVATCRLFFAQPDSGAGFFSPRSFSIKCAMYSGERVFRAT